MDTQNQDIVKARSVELAERAYRLKERAEDIGLQQKLDAVGSQLILLTDADRFYKSQILLETAGVWSEDRRSLAHEINILDKQAAGTKDLNFQGALALINSWVQNYIQSPSLAVKEYGLKIQELLAKVSDANDKNLKKEATNAILETIEDLLRQAHTVFDLSESKDSTRSLRAVRDAVLVERELQIDENELQKVNNNQLLQTDRAKAAREALEEIYSKIGQPPASKET